MLRVRGVGREFGGGSPAVAVRHVTLEIGAGEFVAIEGPSGGGKSTLLNIVGLLDHPTAGTYEIRGVSVGGLDERQLAELRSDTFAFIFQSFHLLDRRPVIDSVELNLLYRAVPTVLRRRAALEALDLVGIRNLAWRSANLLSGGERQRVAIARALATHAPVVVADEPTGNLDSANTALVIDAMRALSDRGATVVLVTHDREVAARADRRVTIVDGVLDDPTTKRSAAEDGGPTPQGRPSRLRARDLVTDAVLSVLSRIGRTAGLAAAVAVAVALAIGTFGIAESARAQVAETFDAHASRDVTLSWTTQPEPVTSESRQSLLERVESLAGVDSVSVLDEVGDQELAGVPGRDTLLVTAYSSIGRLENAGRLSTSWSPGQTAAAPGEALIGRNLADQLGIGPIEAGPIVLLDGASIPIVGIIEASPRVPQLMGAIVVENEPLARIDRTTVLVLATQGAAAQVGSQAGLAADPVHPENVSVSTPIDPSTVRQEIETDVFNTLLAFTVLAVLASIAGLANSMLLSVLERKQEFGLRRAVGARRIHIGLLVLIESGFIGLIGGLGGLVVGYVAVLATTIVRHWTPVLDLGLVPLALIGGILAGAIGGVGASVRALRIEPAEALRL